ncbi:MAG: ATP-binding cassette domain-containing protein [Propionibacteriaceae bacterium]|jgi:ABC-2 type transport system ATP-binding protein|nr:ATP-binding cassette domain-containing protein [Propionibacteriaceae bacterium]
MTLDSISRRSFAIETRGLKKMYGKRVAVDGLDMNVPLGGVHGFLGPNGSGKTTTIRMLLGLTTCDGGEMNLLGKPVPKQLTQVIRHVGAVVEQPKFFAGFTARFSLELQADVMGLPHNKVDEVLEQTGLTDWADDKYRTFSLGMKQRLAIAAALLKDPELLIFDEPTNGLDPGGIYEVREAIRDLGRAGRTVLISSHLLAEVEQMADTVTIIAKGRTLAEGSVNEITGNRSSDLEIAIRDPATARLVLTHAGFDVRSEGRLIVVHGVADPANVGRALAARNMYVDHMVRRNPDLESVFLDLTDGIGIGEMAIDVPDAPPPPGAKRAGEADHPRSGPSLGPNDTAPADSEAAAESAAGSRSATVLAPAAAPRSNPAAAQAAPSGSRPGGTEGTRAAAASSAPSARPSTAQVAPASPSTVIEASARGWVPPPGHSASSGHSVDAAAGSHRAYPDSGLRSIEDGGE